MDFRLPRWLTEGNPPKTLQLLELWANLAKHVAADPASRWIIGASSQGASQQFSCANEISVVTRHKMSQHELATKSCRDTHTNWENVHVYFALRIQLLESKWHWPIRWRLTWRQFVHVQHQNQNFEWTKCPFISNILNRFLRFSMIFQDVQNYLHRVQLTQLWKIIVFNGITHYKWPCSMAM